jgi:Xaa-Pro dipeptidase
MREYGVSDAWAPTQNPNVVSGTDRGHSHATDRVIQHGDVIQTDFGIRVFDTWVTDIQRFAYVLQPNETQVPKDIAHYWESAKQGRQAAFNAMKPGATGKDVDAAQRAVMVATNSKHVMWSTGHPVGYVAHDSGPSLSSTHENGAKRLKAGMTFAFDGFHSWIMDNGQPKTISVEEMVVITDKGAQYLIPPQQDLILIK